MPARDRFGPESVTRRVNAEAVVLLGGGRALLLQVAHPLVAAGVAAHSRFRSEPLTRLWRTLDLMLTLVFADRSGALVAARQIGRAHTRVHGVLETSVGVFPAGTPYDANDPALLLWVWATLVDTGIPERRLPATVADFDEYVASMIASGLLAIGPAGRELAEAVLRPPVPIGLREVFRVAAFFTAGLLPPTLRAQYGLSWSAAHELVLDAFAAFVRRMLPLLPASVRLVPHARRAQVARPRTLC